MCSISSGEDCTGPPAPPCSRENTLVDNRAAAPKSCLSVLEMRSPSAAGSLLSTGEASRATRTTFNQPPLRLFSTEETDSKTNWRTRILYISYDSSFLPAAHSYRMVIETKPGEIGRSIHAVLKAVSTPARFGDRGARCFVVSLCVLEQLDETAAIFGVSTIRDSKAFRRAVRTKLRRAYSGQSAGSLKQGRL